MDRFEYLFRRYVAKTASAEERAEFQDLLAEDRFDQRLRELIDEYIAAFEPGGEVLLLRPAQQALDTILNSEESAGRFRFSFLKRWPRIVAAASVVLALGIGSLVYFKAHHQKKQEIAYKNDVAPGHEGATLTLSDGRKIKLSAAGNGRLADESGVRVEKTKAGHLVYRVIQKGEGDKVNTLSTGYGETYQVALPDGTQVWLNSASSLTYRASLDEEGKRKVALTGEGYFEVAKDRSHPFIVEAAGQQVEVLGTHFNVNSYADEPVVATTLLEGSVKVSAAASARTIVPGEQARSSGGGISVARVNTGQVVDWKDGDFNLEGVDFRAAMRKLGRWYNVEFVYDRSVPGDIEAGGWISRSSPLSAVLKSIENSGQVRFKIEGRKVLVFK